jgi:iron(III) transport system ATP-binding protein
VALARALILKPKVLLFDEPLSNLDANLRRSMRDKIRELQKQFNITSLYVTHDQSEAFAVSDTVLVMNKGHIMQMGSPQNLYRQPASRFMASFMGDANLFPATFHPQLLISMDTVCLCRRISRPREAARWVSVRKPSRWVNRVMTASVA